MNKEYIQSGETFIVSTDKGLKKVKRLDNMIEILETENNIEEIENLKKKNDNEEIFNYKNILSSALKRFFKKFFSITLPIIAITTIVISIVNNVYVALVTLPLLLSGDALLLLLSSPFHMYKTDKIINKMSKRVNDLLDDELEKENQKIKELKKGSKILPSNDLGILGETIKINRTELIEKLKNKLEIISAYQLMKKDLMKFSKDYLLLSKKLEDMGYSESDVNFIYELMKQDIKEKEKAKTLKLEKK